MKVPFQNLYLQYTSIKAEIDAAIADCLNNSQFIGGDKVKLFEQDFAAYTGTQYCVTCGNGTDSIEIILSALGISAGDEVIVPAHSWISTSEAVSSVGAKPVFVDTRSDLYTIDTTKIADKITSRTKAIIPVHLYGLPAEMDEILAIAEKHNLHVVEDCAQAHGATYKGRKVGTFGVAASFSFYPGKNLGAYGDAGGIVTNDAGLAERCRQIANHGQIKKNVHVSEGRNSRLDTIQAAVLSVKLKHLSNWNERRRMAAKKYFELLHGADIVLPLAPDYSAHVYHLFVIQIENREMVKGALTEAGIETSIHYPTMLPFLAPYGFPETDFPACYSYQNSILTLPMFPEITTAEIEYVCDTLLRALKQ